MFFLFWLSLISNIMLIYKYILPQYSIFMLTVVKNVQMILPATINTMRSDGSNWRMLIGWFFSHASKSILLFSILSIDGLLKYVLDLYDIQYISVRINLSWKIAVWNFFHRVDRDEFIFIIYFIILVYFHHLWLPFLYVMLDVISWDHIKIYLILSATIIIFVLY